MGYVFDLDPTHHVLRITVTTTVTDAVFRDIYRALERHASQGGPYAAILDLSRVEAFPLSSDTIRTFAATAPAVPGERPRVVVASEPAVYGLSRMFELHRDSMGGQLHVVRSLDEAYELLEVSPEDFTEHLTPENLAA
jgi:hypothetical protein